MTPENRKRLAWIFSVISDFKNCKLNGQIVYADWRDCARKNECTEEEIEYMEELEHLAKTKEMLKKKSVANVFYE